MGSKDEQMIMTDSLLSQIGKIQTACSFHCNELKNHQCPIQVECINNPLGPIAPISVMRLSAS